MPRLELIRPGTPDRHGKHPLTRKPIVIPGERPKHEVLEIEVRGDTVQTWVVRGDGAPRTSTVRFGTKEQANEAYVKHVGRATRRGLRDVGPCRALAPSREAGDSTLLLDDHFASGDPGFLDEVLACASDKKLATLAAPWMNDGRPAMRRALLAYVDDGCDRHHHKVLVKRLYKLAESRQDDELMAHFLVAFDRLSRRYLVSRYTWVGGESARRKSLVSDPISREKLGEEERAPRFTRATRRYLARRAFRYFRAVGRTDRARYGRSIRGALALYEDAHLDTPERLLDAWGLLHALYAWSPALDRGPRGVRVTAGFELGRLEPAPYWPDAWRGVRDDLLDLVARARSRTVRGWTVAWLKKEYAEDLDGLPVERARALLASPHDEAVRLGAQLLERSTGLGKLLAAEWLELLSIGDLEALSTVCRAFERHVAPERLALAACVDLALSPAGPVAGLGLRWARAKGAGGADIGLIARVAGAPIAAVRAEGARWAIDLLAQAPDRRGLVLRDLLDARFADVRAIALAHADAEHAAIPLPLWLSLLESPYDDVRALVVRHAEAWEAEVGADEMRHVAATVILAVHRGAATKQPLLRRIAARVVARPDEADRLFPVLALALRSVRAPERTAALLAVARAAIGDERLRGAVGRHFPDLVVDLRVSA